MKDQSICLTAEINLAVFFLYAGVRGLGRRMLSLAGRLAIVDFPSAVGARRARVQAQRRHFNLVSGIRAMTQDISVVELLYVPRPERGLARLGVWR